MKVIARYLGGSHAYGLKIEGRGDEDVRFVFLNTEIKNIIGLNKHEHQITINDKEDSAGFEIKHFLSLARKSNTQIMEAMWNKVWIEKTPAFDTIQTNKFDLTSSNQLFKCFRGYLNGEVHIIKGSNTGKLGAKRKLQLEKYGYSNSNCVHALRLLRSGILFFRDNIYPVNIAEEDKDYGNEILDIKLHPENYKVENLLKLIEELELQLVEVFDSRAANYEFNEDLANEIIFDNYFPLLEKHKNKV